MDIRTPKTLLLPRTATGDLGLVIEALDKLTRSLAGDLEEMNRRYESRLRVSGADPATPYAFGDLWLNTGVLTMKVCIQARGKNEAYNAADWVVTSAG